MATYYDLKRKKDGRPTTIGKLLIKNDRSLIPKAVEEYIDALDSFDNGWKKNPLDDYWQAPKKKASYVHGYSALESFGINDELDRLFCVVHYKGEIVAPDTGRFRFWGFGDDVLMIRLGDKLVLDASLKTGLSSWKSDDKSEYKSDRSNHVVVGDWVQLEKGQRVGIEILIGNTQGYFISQLVVEQEGKTYDAVYDVNGFTENPRPILPIFKLSDISEQEARKLGLGSKYTAKEGPIF